MAKKIESKKLSFAMNEFFKMNLLFYCHHHVR